MKPCASFHNMDVYHWASMRGIDHHLLLWWTPTDRLTLFVFCRSLVRGWNDAGSYWCVIRSWNVSETTLDSRLLVVLLWSDAGNAIGQFKKKKLRGDKYHLSRTALLDLVPKVSFVRVEETLCARGWTLSRYKENFRKILVWHSQIYAANYWLMIEEFSFYRNCGTASVGKWKCGIKSVDKGQLCYYAALLSDWMSEWVSEWVGVTIESGPTTNSADFDPMFPDLRDFPRDGVFFRVILKDVA